MRRTPLPFMLIGAAVTSLGGAALIYALHQIVLGPASQGEAVLSSGMMLVMGLPLGMMLGLFAWLMGRLAAWGAGRLEARRRRKESPDVPLPRGSYYTPGSRYYVPDYDFEDRPESAAFDPSEYREATRTSDLTDPYRRP